MLKITVASRNPENKTIFRIIISRKNVKCKIPVKETKIFEDDTLSFEKSNFTPELQQEELLENEFLPEDSIEEPKLEESIEDITLEAETFEDEGVEEFTQEEPMTPEEQKQKFLEEISAKNEKSLEEHALLEIFCASIGISDKVLMSGIYYANRSKNEKNFYQNVATDCEKNAAVIKVEMKKAFAKWFTTYPDETPKEFEVTLSEFLNVFRTGFKKF